MQSQRNFDGDLQKRGAGDSSTAAAEVLKFMRSVSTNPAFERIQSSSSFLLLQGPLGPFFDRLTHWLQERGKRVSRVAFQAGDVHDCRAIEPVIYRGTPAAWRDFLSNLVTRLDVDCIILFGQSRFYHQVARELATELNISLVVLEEGYFRPGFITMELNGVNGYSRTLQQFTWQPPSGVLSSIEPDITPWHFQKMAWHASLHYMSMHKGASAFPHYRHHRSANPYYYATYWVRSWARKLVKRNPDRAFQRKLFESHSPYFLVPLQHDGDAQITHHSPYGQNTDFIIQVLRSFADHAPRDHWLVFRQHPHSRGGAGHSRLIQSLSKELGVEQRVHHMVEGDTPDLAQHSAGVVLINSTVGLQALERGAPLMVLGEALYKQPHLVYQGSLDTFWCNPVRPPLEETSQFLAQMKNLTQMPCSVYANHGEPLRWSAHINQSI